MKIKVIATGTGRALKLAKQDDVDIILVNSEKHPDVNYQTVKVFASWISSKNTKKMINNYKINQQQLFFTE